MRLEFQELFTLCLWRRLYNSTLACLKSVAIVFVGNTWTKYWTWFINAQVHYAWVLQTCFISHSVCVCLCLRVCVCVWLNSSVLFTWEISLDRMMAIILLQTHEQIPGYCTYTSWWATRARRQIRGAYVCRHAAQTHMACLCTEHIFAHSYWEPGQLIQPRVI